MTKGYLILAESPALGTYYEPTVEPVEILQEEGDKLLVRRRRGENLWEEYAPQGEVLLEEDLSEAPIPIVLPDDPLVGLPALLALHLQGAVRLTSAELRNHDPEELLRAYLVGLRHPEATIGLEAVEAVGEAALGTPYALALRDLLATGKVRLLVPRLRGDEAEAYEAFRLELDGERVRVFGEGSLAVEELLEAEPHLDLTGGDVFQKGILLGKGAGELRPPFPERVEGKSVEALAELFLRLRPKA